MPTEFRLPSLGEGIEEADVLKVLVSEGDEIAVDQPVLEIETEKATLDVPSSVAGRVTSISVSPGETIRVGQVLLVIETTAASDSAQSDAAEPPATEGTPTSALPRERGRDQTPEEGSTTETDGRVREPVEAERTETPVTQAARARDAQEKPPEEETPPSAAERPPEAALPTEEPRSTAEAPFASPSVRTFAREIGVDIAQVAGSGRGGRISEDDVKQHARGRDAGGAPREAAAPAAVAGPSPAPALPDFEQWGPVEREPLTRFRRTVARNMSNAWEQIPHVTLHTTADVTELEAVRQRFKPRAAEAGGNLTLSVMLLKIVAGALKANPRVNASVDIDSGELILKRYVHIGTAVDTERGLIVPVIRNVDDKNIIQLSIDLARAAERAREGKLTPDETRGGTFTVTNLGSLGTGHFTPIINWPELGVLGLGRAQQVPTYVDGELQPRLILPLSLSHDHRVIDGADGQRFLNWIIDAINEPLLLALEG